MKRIMAVFLVLTMVFVFSSCGNGGIYKKAVNAFSAGNYEEAASMFAEIGDYKDSAEMQKKSLYQHAEKLMNDGLYEDAISVYTSLGGYMDASEKLTEAKKQLMLKTYSSEIALLEANWWVVNGGAENSINYYEFKDGEATIGNVWFDGNGRHDSTPLENIPFEMNDTTIITQTPKGEALEIPYTFTDGKIVLGDGQYFSPDMIKEGIQGCWKQKYFDYNATLKMYSRGEYNIEIDGDTMTYEDAALSAYDYSSYFYYGPYTGFYKIIIGGFEATLNEVNSDYTKDAGSMWFYNIIDGKVAMLRYNSVCEKTDSLPGKDGYYSLIP